MNDKTPPTLAWHFLKDDAFTRYSNEKVEIGKTLKADGPLELCSNGMHASLHPLDALKYAPGFLLCRVEVEGKGVVCHTGTRTCFNTELAVAGGGQ